MGVVYVNLAIALKPDEAITLYNAACAYCIMHRIPDAIDALQKAWNAGYQDANWTRPGPDLAVLHGHPESDGLYPEPGPATS